MITSTTSKNSSKSRETTGITRNEDKIDLVYTHSLTLTEALTFCTVPTPTLDGKTIYLACPEVIHPRYKRRIIGEGMSLLATDTRSGGAGCGGGGFGAGGHHDSTAAPATEDAWKTAAQKQGDLIVKFNIIFPKTIPLEMKMKINQIFSWHQENRESSKRNVQ
jgi:DnaJ-class molecular chaperone